MPVKTKKEPSLLPESSLAAILVGQGKVLDFIDGQTQREDTPEEYVRQEIAKSLVREYDFPKTTLPSNSPSPSAAESPGLIWSYLDLA